MALRPHRPVAQDAPAGIARVLKRRRRRITATYRLGRDPAVNVVPRSAARLISAYDRAPVRAVFDTLDIDIWAVDGPVLWLLRRIVFALAGRPRGDDDPALDAMPPGSGWRGTALVLAIWGAILAIGLWLLQRWPVVR